MSVTACLITWIGLKGVGLATRRAGSLCNHDVFHSAGRLSSLPSDIYFIRAFIRTIRSPRVLFYWLHFFLWCLSLVRVIALFLSNPLYLPGFQKFGRRGDPTAATSCYGLRGAAREAE